jgi:hypothetical protein
MQDDRRKSLSLDAELGEDRHGGGCCWRRKDMIKAGEYFLSFSFSFLFLLRWNFERFACIQGWQKQRKRGRKSEERGGAAREI